MILADKIITLRKKNGWSQEELAEKLNVTRQSVSKWEGAQSIPDLNKILQMGKIFGVSTDYLLKDEIDQEEYTTMQEEAEAVRTVSMEEARDFLSIKAITAKRIAFATFLCILSPICLIVLATASDSNRFNLGENASVGIGLITLMVMVAIAVAIFISCGAKTRQFEYLEHENIETEYGVSGMARERQSQYRGTYTLYNILGTCLCILSTVPLFGGMSFTEDELLLIIMLSVTLLLVGIGVIFFIIAGVNWASLEKLLQEGDYTKQKKSNPKVSGAVGTVYWLVVVAGFLAYSFITNDWGSSWIIWPVAGVLFAAVMVICSIFEKKSKG